MVHKHRQMDELLAATEQAMAAERGALAELRAWPTRRRVAVVAVAVGLMAVAVLFGTPRADLDVFPRGRLSVAIAALAVAVAGGIFAALGSVTRPSSPRRVWITVAIGFVIPIGLALLPPAHLDHPASLAGVGDDLGRRAAACFAFGMATGVPLAVAGWLVARAGFAAERIRVGLLVLASAAGNLSLVLHCPLTAVVHRVAGHAAVTAVLALAALVVLGAARRSASGRDRDPG